MAELLIVATPLLLLGIVLCLCFVGCTFTPGAASCDPYDETIGAESGLAAYWRLDESAGTTAHDLKAGHDGTYEGGVTLGASGLISGDTDPAVGFDGSSGQVSVPFAAALNGAQFAADMWVVFDDVPGAERAVVSSFDESQHSGWAIVAGASHHWEAVVGDGSSWLRVQSGIAVTAGETTYLVASYDGNTLSLGAVSASGNLDQFQAQLAVSNFKPNTTGALSIGGPGPEGAAPFKGVIDEVAIYGAALTLDQASSHFNAGICKTVDSYPVSIVQDPSPIGVTTATLRGEIDPHGTSSTYHFDYGLDTNYGSSQPVPDASAGSATVYEPIAQPISGLSPHTTYHFRVTASYTVDSNTYQIHSVDDQFTTHSSSAYRDAVLSSSGLVAYWRLDEISGAMAFALGPGGVPAGAYVGTYIAGPTLNATPGALDASGDPDPAASFNGQTQYVHVALPAPSGLAGDFSIEFWLKTTSPGAGTGQWWQGTGLVDGDVPGVQNDFGTSIDSGGHILAGVGNRAINADTTISSPASYLDGAWHYVVYTRVQATGTLNLYVDGNPTPVATRTGTNTGQLAATQSLAFARVQTQPNYLNGSLDEIAVYSRALSGAEIQNRYTLATTVTQQ